MRRHENTGRPLGAKAFVQRLEKLLDRRVLPARPGGRGRRRRCGRKMLDPVPPPTENIYPVA
jgi:hypothetical protein